MLNIGWFSSGRGDGSYGLLKATLDAIDARKLNARLGYIVCTAEPGEAEGSDRFLKLAEEHSIKTYPLSWRRFKNLKRNRAQYEWEILNLISGHQVDVGMMAGYMLVSNLLHKRIRMLNLHPALPGGPTGTWKQVLNRVITERDPKNGVMIHEVSDEVDGGTALTYCHYDTKDEHLQPLWRDVGRARLPRRERLLDGLRQQILDRERPLMVETLSALANRVVNFDAKTPLDLTGPVENHLNELSITFQVSLTPAYV